MSDFFNQEDDFRDNPVEMENGQWNDTPVTAAPPSVTESQRKAIQDAKVRAQQSKQPEPVQVIEEEFEIPEIDMDAEEDYTSVMADARLRLEQGRLYEMIMNHELFDGMDADPAAVKHVQRQIRKFAKEQMEIMLGMRKETSIVEHLEIDFPFNSVEVNVLKKLAFAASKGASENSDRFVPAVTKTTEEVQNIPTPRKEGLNKIGTKSSPVKSATAKPLPSKAKSPIQRSAPQPVIKAGLPQNEQDLLELDYKPLDKHPSQMNDDEKLARLKESQQRQAGKKSVKSASALPQPTPQQEEMLHTQNVLTSSASGTVATLMTLINNQKKK